MSSRRPLASMITLVLGAAMGTELLAAEAVITPPKDDGYRGIWYYNQPSKDEYVYKYSGGLGTYPANHIPFCIYAPAANKTFFFYGGTSK